MKTFILSTTLIALTLFSCNSNNPKREVDKYKSYNDSMVEASVEKRRLADLEEKKDDSIRTINNNKEIKKLLSFFNIKKDEFSSDDMQWVIPKNAPRHIDNNAIFCYFQITNNKAFNFRLKIQYASDDWLFIQQYKFSIDGMVFDYIPDEIKRDNDSSIWEWSDQQIADIDNSMINALGVAKKAKIRFIGQQYHADRIITSTQLLSIKRTLKLYKLMGGSL